MTASLRSTLDALSQHNAMVAVGEFAAALSHDVRNALTSIRVDVERTAHRPMDEAHGSAVLQRVLNNVACLDSLVSGALRLARGKHMMLIDVDVMPSVRAAAEIVAGAFAAVPATLAIDAPDEPVMARGDASALEQLLANVLFNAVQAVRPGGEAHVRVVRDTGAVVFETDDGIGMDDEQISRIQQPFHSSKSNGTGLGSLSPARSPRRTVGSLSWRAVRGAGRPYSFAGPRPHREPHVAPLGLIPITFALGRQSVAGARARASGVKRPKPISTLLANIPAFRQNSRAVFLRRARCQRQRRISRSSGPRADGRWRAITAWTRTKTATNAAA